MTTVTPTAAELDRLRPDDRPAIVRLATELAVEPSPLEAFRILADGPAGTTDRYAFLLESADKIDASDPDGAFQPRSEVTDRHARYSFVGYDPVAVIQVRGDSATVQALDSEPLVDHIAPDGSGVMDSLRTSLPSLPRIGFENGDRQLLEGGLVGVLEYEAVYDMWLEQVGVERPDTDTPDAEFVLATKTLVFDEIAGTCSLVCTPLVPPDRDSTNVIETIAAEAERVESALEMGQPEPLGGFEPETNHADPREDYEAAVRQAKEHVRDGDIYQGVLSREHRLTGAVDPRGFYAALRDINPSPYMYLLEFGDRSIVGASPETLVSVRGDTVTSNPIAGTCPRGQSPVEDRRLAGEMLADEKELAEHTMLVDLARNDVRRVGRPGSVTVEEFMSVLKYSHVQHIESTVTAELAADADAFDATRAAFPAGTLAGAPKIRAMEIIDDLERTPRGPYGGGVGYFSWTGDADFAIVIRSAMIDHGTTDEIAVRAGAGIVADSEPAAEFDETEAKMDAVLAALDRIAETPARPSLEVDSS